MKKRILAILLVTAFPLCANAAWECCNYYRASQWRAQAHELEHQHRSAEALRAYQRCLDLYPYFLDVHQEMAEIYIETKDWSHALACLDKAVDACPREAVVYRQRGHCALQAGRLMEARRDLETALQLDPEEDLARRLLEKATSSKDSSPRAPKPAKVETPLPPAK